VIELRTAANGYAWITTPSRRERLWLGLLLMFRYGFWRWGTYVPPITDEAIYPDFIRGKKRILTGWDNWVGYDLLANDPESDRFLRAFYERHVGNAAKPVQQYGGHSS